MTSEDTEGFVREAFESTMLAGEPGAVDQYFSPSLDYYRSSGDIARRQDLKDDVEMLNSAFPNLEGEIPRIIAEESKVSFLYVLRGAHEGTFEGIAPTNEEMEANGAAIAHVDDGEITEYRVVFDNLGMLEQLGVVKA